MKVVNKLTGEVYELNTDTPEDIRESWQLVSEAIKTLEAAKDKLKPMVQAILDDSGQYDFGDYIFKLIPVQRMNYDKSVMRQVLDEDTLDLLLMPDKTAIDNYLKENIETLGDASTQLRNTMVAVGRPYSQLRLERVK